MARWIAFDQETTSLLRSNLAQGTKIDTLRRGPVDFALARPGAVVAVLPAQGPAQESNDLGIAVFRPTRPVATQRPVAEQRPVVAQQPPVRQRPPVAKPPVVAQPPAVQPTAVTQSSRASVTLPLTNRASTRASGFLGLTDEPVFDEEQEAVEEKKSWWRRLWEEWNPL